ncbi:hypothetical protein [Loktanella sp. SALINAS62]|uniref:hypothetical protein n=1 Tax=Loktanella sp. SALINAS62 TaxID=2706124 RepID=UPI001B8D8B7D|nr:hypothetical protein [Loktanella sp. SALINAS62]MBS1301534.1 hypothetical protein [Loktanella sp. SALINAS62]
MAVHHATETFEDARQKIARLAPGDLIDQVMDKANRALERAVASGANQKTINRLRAQFDNLRGLTRERMRANVSGPADRKVEGFQPVDTELAFKQFSESAAQRNSKPIIRAIKSTSNYQHEEVKQQILKIVDRQEKLGSIYRDQLVTDVARVLEICPRAAGIVKALTFRGQKEGMTLMKDIASRGNKAIGSAYELMGTAALGDKTSIASNSKHSAPSLRINVGKDHVVFGAKSHINSSFPDGKTRVASTRKTIESDIQIGRKTPDGYREIGVDFKHVKNAGSKSLDRRGGRDVSQIENVAKAIQSGDLHEYHFVTNGRFSEPFKEAIDKVNDDLVASGNDPIGLHEYVSTLVNDPMSDGKAS